MTNLVVHFFRLDTSTLKSGNCVHSLENQKGGSNDNKIKYKLKNKPISEEDN